MHRYENSLKHVRCRFASLLSISCNEKFYWKRDYTLIWKIPTISISMTYEYLQAFPLVFSLDTDPTISPRHHDSPEQLLLKFIDHSHICSFRVWKVIVVGAYWKCAEHRKGIHKVTYDLLVVYIPGVVYRDMIRRGMWRTINSLWLSQTAHSVTRHALRGDRKTCSRILSTVLTEIHCTTVVFMSDKFKRLWYTCLYDMIKQPRVDAVLGTIDKTTLIVQ